jgi:hypothetical protein
MPQSQRLRLMFHPRMRELYVRKIGQLDALLSGEGDHTIKAMELIRSKIAKVTVLRRSPFGQYSAEFYGDLAAILDAK